MAKPTTEQLKTELQELVDKYNQSIDVQTECRQRIVEVQAILKDREDGSTEDSNSTDSTD